MTFFSSFAALSIGASSPSRLVRRRTISAMISPLKVGCDSG
jgi:hypothetical protein